MWTHNQIRFNWMEFIVYSFSQWISIYVRRPSTSNKFIAAIEIFIRIRWRQTRTEKGRQRRRGEEEGREPKKHHTNSFGDFSLDYILQPLTFFNPIRRICLIQCLPYADNIMKWLFVLLNHKCRGLTTATGTVSFQGRVLFGMATVSWMGTSSDLKWDESVYNALFLFTESWQSRMTNVRAIHSCVSWNVSLIPSFFVWWHLCAVNRHSSLQYRRGRHCLRLQFELSAISDGEKMLSQMVRATC